ncbi:MAG: glycosyltransferase family 4 protein, partial [Bacteroidales bacterium]|nr:glycosyltransferase family 4 protein [Bacteroidales bacterium]
MKIAINTRLLLKNRLEGIGWFTYETLKKITKEHPEHQFYFIFDRKYDEEFIFSSNIEPVVVGPQARHPVLFHIWFEYALPFIFRKIKPDLFLSPDGYLSLSTPVKSVNVIHDLNFEHYPEDLPALARWHYRYFFPRYAKKAERIATVSEFSKQDIVSRYQIDPQKIDVVYNGANDHYEPLSQESKQRTKEKITRGKPYFIFIGALHPRKNLTNLFKSFDKFRKVYQSDIKLVIVGAKKWWTEEIRNTYEKMEFREEVIFTGRLSADELKNALGSALALTYISYFEGFGIP